MRTSRVVQDGRERVDTEWFEIVDSDAFWMLWFCQAILCLMQWFRRVNAIMFLSNTA